ncbi:MAG: hypothetical protein WD042_06000 [Phycisphaeraceae bacterium]
MVPAKMSNLGWSVLLALSTVAVAADQLPIMNMGLMTEPSVRQEAERQAATQPEYKSTKLETKTFIGAFKPLYSTSKLAIFLDDGVDVFVDDRVMSFAQGTTKGKPQALPKLNESFHLVKGPEPDGLWNGGQTYCIRIEYQNAIYTGDADIDGCTLFAYNGGIWLCTLL